MDVPEPDPAPHVNRMVLEIVAEIEVTKAADIASATAEAEEVVSAE